MIRRLSVPSLPGLAAALLLAFAASAAAAADEPAAGTRQGGAADGSGTLLVGMHYVEPPFVGGSKVRTPDAPDTALAEALAKALGYGAVKAVAADAGAAASLLEQGGAQAVLASLPEGEADSAGLRYIATGYESRPMAIMRTDTDIKSWEQLRGRTVCLSAGGRYAGRMAARYGAIEKIKRAPADSLLALRIGECDAAVHDEMMLRALLKLPEWKKFSANLPPPGPGTRLVLAMSSADAKALKAAGEAMADWRRKWAALNRQRVNDIAFEVYLDQTVPDCH